ncbi:MAG: hypothetical protein HW374_982 [Bacteroidetes bacterium]|nr:hypothetical protein [Bacteroidota bacterium]
MDVVKVTAALLLISSAPLFAQQESSRVVSDTVSVGVNDTTSEAEPDSIEEDGEYLPWTISARTEFENTRIKKGVDLSGTNPTTSSAISVLHEAGWNGRFAWSSMLGNEGGPLNWSADIGYDYTLNDWLGLTASFSHTRYFADTINAISELQNSLSIGLAATSSVVDIGIGYEIYFGADPARYWSVDVSHSFEFGSLSVDLSGSLTFMSQTIDAGKLEALGALLKKKKQDPAILLSEKKVTISGISSYSLNLDIRYDLGSGFNVYLDPSYVVSPKGEVSSKEMRLSWTVGVKYSTDF